MARHLDAQSAVNLLFTLPYEDDSCSSSESAADSSGPESENSSDEQDELESEDVNFEMFEQWQSRQICEHFGGKERNG